MSEHLLHKALEGERWDQIAHRYYGDVSKQSVVIAANRNLYVAADGTVRLPPARLPGGTIIRVPVIEEEPSDVSAPPWKRNAPRPPVPGASSGD